MIAGLSRITSPTSKDGSVICSRLKRQSPSAAIGIDLATLRSTEDDPLNELLVEPTREQPLSQVMADLRRTHERLLAVIAAVPEDDLERLAADYQPEELAGDTDSIADWIHHICDEHLEDHIDWMQRLRASSWSPRTSGSWALLTGCSKKMRGRGMPRPSHLALSYRLTDSVPTD